jgi:hypothetical protein
MWKANILQYTLYEVYLNYWINLIATKINQPERSHGLVVKADGSWPIGRGFKPRYRILYEYKQFASYYIKEKLKIKVAKRGTLKKYLKKINQPTNAGPVK